MASTTTAAAAAGDKKKPFLFFVSIPAEGHTNPCITIAGALAKRGYDVAFLSNGDFKEKINAQPGVEYIEGPGVWEFVDPNFAEVMAGLGPGMPSIGYAFSRVFGARQQATTDAVDRELARLRAREGPDRQFIVVHELFSMGVSAFKYGRPPPAGFDRFPRDVAICPAPMICRSVDTAPFLLGLPPDSSESGRLRNRALQKMADEGPLKDCNAEMNACLRRAGATRDFDEPGFDGWYQFPELTLQLGSPGIEYPLSDMRPNIRFTGCLPRRPAAANWTPPDWWSEVATPEGRAGRKVVFVSQGTVETKQEQLIIPTMRALEARDDVLVVVALGVKGAALPEGFAAPANARVADYLPYDLALEHSDVFVSNAGYGSVCHAVMNGVPCVFAGETQDKLENSMRAEWAGYGYKVGTQTPTPDQVRTAIDTVLADPKYKARAVELRRENEDMDCISSCAKAIEDLTE